MATDHSTIQTFPASRWIELQATGTNAEEVTLPTALTPLRLSILKSVETDKSTAAACSISFDQTLGDGDGMPSISEGSDLIQVASGVQLTNVTLPANGATRVSKMFVGGANSGWVNVAYDVAPGGGL